MTRFKSFLLGALASATLASFAEAQLNDQTQTRLESMAVEVLQTSQSLSDLAKAAELLSLLDKSSSSHASKACKRISKLVIDSDSTPSTVFNKALLHQHLKCDTLSGIGSEIETVLSGHELALMDDDQLYFAYLLQENAGAFETKESVKDKVLSVLKKRAKDDWLPNFNEDKWTMKRHIMETNEAGSSKSERISVQELDSQLLNVSEMMASLMEESDVKSQVSDKLKKALKLLVENSVPASGRFFVSKNIDSVNAAELTFSAVKAIETFNKHASTKIDKLEKNKLRDYFLVKASASSSVEQASLALKALGHLMTNKAEPFLKVVAGKSLMFGESGSFTL